jgi:predicted small metal-binding protein
MLKFKCRDVGFDCGFTAKAKTEDEIMQKCAIHAQEDHGMKPEDITDDLKNKIRVNPQVVLLRQPCSLQG